jgi:DNA polymerase-3 subunit delta
MGLLLPLSKKRRTEHLTSQLFVFYGEEDYLIQQRISVLKNELADPLTGVERYDGEEVDLPDLAASLQSAPLLFGERLVVIKNVDLSQSSWDVLLPSLKLIPSGTKVVFWAKAVSLKSKLLKYVQEKGEVLEYRPYAEWEGQQAASWIKKQVESLGKEISFEAAMLLLEICGSNLQKLSSEIDKLVTYVGARKVISIPDVQTLASPGESSVFSLLGALALKDRQAALRVLQLLITNKVDFSGMLSLLANQYRVMLFSKGLPEFNRTPQKIAPEVGANPYFVKKCLEKAGKFTEEELKKDLALILDADLKLKSGEEIPTTLELLCWSLCEGGKAKE